MNKIKKLLMIGLIGLVALAPAFSTNETGTLNLVVSIGETPTNTGIRITEDSSILDINNFDTKFYNATSFITLNGGRIDENAYTDDLAYTSDFSVLVRKNTEGPVEVTVEASPLANGAKTLKYILKFTNGTFDNYNNPNTLTITSEAKNDKYEASKDLGSGDGIIRDQAIFQINIPKQDLAAAGEYKATITFKLTTN